MIGSALDGAGPLRWIDAWPLLEPGQRNDIRALTPPSAAAPAPPPAVAPASLVSAPPMAPSSGAPSRLRWLAAGAGSVLLLLLVWILSPDDTPSDAWASTHAEVTDVSVEPVSEGLWKLIIAVEYTPAATRGDATVACTLRRNDPEERDVKIAVILSPDFSSSEFSKEFRVPDWQPGRYPVDCVVGGKSVFAGDIDWKP